MTKRNYEKLSIEIFGAQLLQSNDLDPIYVALWRLLKVEDGWSLDQVKRWLVAYWCLYHAGAASYLCEFEHQQFWDELMHAAVNDPKRGNPADSGALWPRGSERRYFRGEAAVSAVYQLSKRYSRPESMVDYIIHPPQLDIGLKLGFPYKTIADRTKEHRLFGPWIAFKVGDMVDRVLEVPVDFTQAGVFMFRDPAKAALMLWAQRNGLPNANAVPNKGAVIEEVVDSLVEHFKDSKAPPAYDRRVGLQEVETILCKWKSHMNGHYPLYNDIDEIIDGLTKWSAASKQVNEFKRFMPRRVAP